MLQHDLYTRTLRPLNSQTSIAAYREKCRNKGNQTILFLRQKSSTYFRPERSSEKQELTRTSKTGLEWAWQRSPGHRGKTVPADWYRQWTVSSHYSLTTADHHYCREKLVYRRMKLRHCLPHLPSCPRSTPPNLHVLFNCFPCVFNCGCWQYQWFPILWTRKS